MNRAVVFVPRLLLVVCNLVCQWPCSAVQCSAVHNSVVQSRTEQNSAPIGSTATICAQGSSGERLSAALCPQYTAVRTLLHSYLSTCLLRSSRNPRSEWGRGLCDQRTVGSESA